MAKNCAACDELRNDAPNLIVNGLTNTEIASLKNNTGFSPSNGNDDCTDLNNANDCLIGNMESEVDAYDVCDWRTFMKEFIGNAWTMFASIIAAICGIWTKIKNLEQMASRIDCIVDYMMKGSNFSFDEYTSGGGSYIVAGKGVSFANVSQSGTANDISITYVAGGMGYITGSCIFYKDDFTDAKAVANYDDGGINPTTSANRKGNPRWETDGYLGTGGELAYELRIKKSEYPQIGRFWQGISNASAGGLFDAILVYRDEGQYAPGQRGWCNMNNGDPQGTDSDRGHLVPAGYMYLQMRMKGLESFNPNATQYTPVGLIPMRINEDSIEC